MFGTRLKELRGKKGFSQRDLAKLIQLSPSTVAMYELGQRSPDMYTVIKLANFFNCTTDYLLGNSNVWHQSGPNEPTNTSYKRLPVLDTFEVGLPILAEENIKGYLDMPQLIEADFAFKVTGDRMKCVGILDGDYAICRQVTTAYPEQVVLVINYLSSGFSEATLNFYSYNKSSKDQLPLFRSANPNYPDIIIQEGYKIAGVMVALLRRQAPGYNTYKNNLKEAGYEEWIEVIQKANQYGIKPHQLKIFIELQWQMFKKFIDND